MLGEEVTPDEILDAFDQQVTKDWTPVTATSLAKDETVLYCRCTPVLWRGKTLMFIRARLFRLWAKTHSGSKCGPEERRKK